jgi:DNA-binding CsgD family transcriptional regulator
MDPNEPHPPDSAAGPAVGEEQPAPAAAGQRGNLLTSIVRRRRRPLLLVIDEDGELLLSSVPDHAPAAEHRLLGQALAEAKSLFINSIPPETGGSSQPASRPGMEGDGQRSLLVSIGNEFFSLRVVPLHGAGEDGEEQFAALVEPIVEPLTEGVDFALIRRKFRLSNREGDVLEALMSGRKDKEIAQSVGLTTGTVRSYLKSIRAKLGVTTRTAIVNLVHEHGTEVSVTH